MRDQGRALEQDRRLLVDLGVAALHDPHLPTTHGMRPTVQVTVALSTLLDLDQQPAELAGHGPIPASVARRIAADETSTWRRLITDPVDNTLLNYGTTTYRPPADLAAFVITRDQICTFPHCRHPAHRCDLDHQTPAAQRGPTNRENITALCRRHHRAKHHAGWRVSRNDNTNTSQWTSPTATPTNHNHPTYPTTPPTTPTHHRSDRRTSDEPNQVAPARAAEQS